MDSRSLSVLQSAAAAEVGLPPSLAHRLNGGSYDELVQDGKKALKDFGLVEPQPRGPDGRFTMSDAIRAATGRTPVPAPEQPEGDLGVGRGGSALPRQPQRVSMNDLIRATRGVQVSAVSALAERNLRSRRIAQTSVFGPTQNRNGPQLDARKSRKATH